jgi:putative hydrolase of the HAD superfamily
MHKTFASGIRAIAFDADDTLWDCQQQFDDVERQYEELLSPWASREDIATSLLATERRNMPHLGFGSKAFTISLIENAISISQQQVDAATLAQILQLGFGLIRQNAQPLPGVVETLSSIRKNGALRMAVFTKGELLTQENKLARSGLELFFDHVSIVTDKTEQAYRDLCHELEVCPDELLMVGNSFKSDIAPALAIGCSAVHIPYHVSWTLEEAEEFEHSRLRRIAHISELLAYLQ